MVTLKTEQWNKLYIDVLQSTQFHIITKRLQAHRGHTSKLWLSMYEILKTNSHTHYIDNTKFGFKWAKLSLQFEAWKLFYNICNYEILWGTQDS